MERDEKEQNERRLLNLGHTIGHAIEKCSAYSIPHGHAVAAGLAIIARSAQRLGWTEEPIAERICACLSKNGLPIEFEEGDLERYEIRKKVIKGEIKLEDLPQPIVETAATREIDEQIKKEQMKFIDAQPKNEEVQQ